MRIELELERTGEQEFEYEVWGSYEGQEVGEHWASFDRFEEAVEYKAEQEEANQAARRADSRRSLLTLQISRRPRANR